MVTLTINNSYSKISGLSPKDHKRLADALSYVVGGKSAYFSKFGPRRRSLLDKRGEFPTGLLHRVLALMPKATFTFKYANKRPISNIKTTMSTIIPYEDQVAAVSAAVLARRGTIAMPTGSGKSLVIAMLAYELRARTLVVVPSLEIKRQLQETLKSLFKDDSWVTVENIDSTALKKSGNYDCLIIDEAHHVAAKTYQKLNRTSWSGIYYKFFFTATPFRNDAEEQLLFEGIAGEIIYNLSYKTAIAKKYIVPVEAYYLEMPKQDTNAYTYAQVYSELVVKNDIRNATIANLLLKLQDVSTLCLVREVAHGKIISELTGIPFVSGEDEDSRQFIHQFNSGEIKSLIGTTGILGEGVDTKPCEYVIIAGLGKAKSQFMQQVGRAVRKHQDKESAKVILIKDKSHRFLLRHFNAQKKILLEEYNSLVLRLNLSEDK